LDLVKKYTCEIKVGETPEPFSSLSQIARSDIDDSAYVIRKCLGKHIKTCCINVNSQEGTITRLEYLQIANLIWGVFRLLLHRCGCPFSSTHLYCTFSDNIS
jgi:hypothetical protein